MSYKSTEMHSFIRNHLLLNGCKVEESDNHFSVKYPDQLLPTKYTYNPEVAESQKMELVTAGSRFFNSIIREALDTGIVSSIEVQRSNENQAEIIRSFFTPKDERCTECAKGNYELCPKLVKCGHKINGASIKNITSVKKSSQTILQFYFLVEFNNRFRKSDEVVPIAVSVDGESVAPMDIYSTKTSFREAPVSQKIDSQKHLKKAISILKQDIKKKIDFFNKQLDYEIAKKIKSIEKKFKDEKMEKRLNKEKFDEKEWEKTLNKTIESEKKSLGTTISIKMINCLIINAPLEKFNIELSNGSVIQVDAIDKFHKTFHPQCTECKKKITEGYATIDKKYVCSGCTLRCIETGNIFSKASESMLNRCNTSNEALSQDCGFNCSNCNTMNSKYFMYRCAGSGEPICVKCYDFCSYCDKPFSIKNMNSCKESSNLYCKMHSSACGKCGSHVGIDSARFSGEMHGAFCSCLDAKQCKICEDYYSDGYLQDRKCHACRNLKLVLSDNQEIAQIRANNKEYERVVDWMVAANRFNKIIVAKGDPVDTIFVARPGIIKFIKKARLADL